MRSARLSWKSISFVFTNSAESKHMTCLYTAWFSTKVVSADKRKNLLGCGSPVETSAKQKHRPSRQARHPKPLDRNLAYARLKSNWKNFFRKSVRCPENDTPLYVRIELQGNPKYFSGRRFVIIGCVTNCGGCLFPTKTRTFFFGDFYAVGVKWESFGSDFRSFVCYN